MPVTILYRAPGNNSHGALAGDHCRTCNVHGGLAAWRNLNYREAFQGQRSVLSLDVVMCRQYLADGINNQQLIGIGHRCNTIQPGLDRRKVAATEQRRYFSRNFSAPCQSLPFKKAYRGIVLLAADILCIHRQRNRK